MKRFNILILPSTRPAKAPYEEAFMKTQFKSNNFIAVIIALILFAVGFLLFFIHKQSEASQTQGRVKTTMTSQAEFLSVNVYCPAHINLREWCTRVPSKTSNSNA